MPDYRNKKIGGVECTALPEGGWEWDVGRHHFRLTFFGGYLRLGEHIVHESDHSPVRMVPWSQGYVQGLADAYREISGRE